MRNRRVLFGVLVVATVGLATFFLFRGTGQRASGPLPHEVYVWQRAWIQPVREAISQHATNFTRVVALKAEIAWNGGKPHLSEVPVDYPTLVQAHQSVGLALRIGPHPGPFASNDAVASFLGDVAASLVTEARSNYLTLSELQLDFDCAESKLDGYRLWVEAIQHRVSPLPVTITALPSWLDSRAFKRLAAVATNYVLQVHSMERPRRLEAPAILCDPRAARRAVERAGRIGVPFRVALPTYGYLLGFDLDSRFLGLSAEGPRPNWPTNTRLRAVFADPLDLSGLVQRWATDRPQALSGVIWFRLPVAVDKFNWRWPTLGAIVQSRVLSEKLRADARRVEPGLVEISLVNEGDLDISSRLAVEVRWRDARLMAGEASRDFKLVELDFSTAKFLDQRNPSRLPAGDSLTLGRLRLDRDCEVTCEVKRF